MHAGLLRLPLPPDPEGFLFYYGINDFNDENDSTTLQCTYDVTYNTGVDSTDQAFVVTFYEKDGAVFAKVSTLIKLKTITHS